ncbi:hypothetical protein R6Q59_007718 [Mikania micrantha]
MEGLSKEVEVPAKHAAVDRLRKWRQAALVLNAQRRFAYMLDQKRRQASEEETTVLTRFRLSDIELATKNFVETYCIGLDANGIVYKAEDPKRVQFR